MADERQLLKALISCVEPIPIQDRKILKSKIEELKRGDDAEWAIGETIERIKIFYGCLDENDLIQVKELLKEYYTGG
jgi:hypothetical protein